MALFRRVVCFGLETIREIDARFQRLVYWIIGSWGDAPGSHETAPLALE